MRSFVTSIAILLRGLVVLAGLSIPLVGLADPASSAPGPTLGLPSSQELQEILRKLRSSPRSDPHDRGELSAEQKAQLVQKLVSFGPDILPQLQPYLYDEDTGLCTYTFEVFARVGGEYARVELLAAYHASPGFKLRLRALRALSTMKPPPDEFWGLLSSSLKDPDTVIQVGARIIQKELKFAQVAPAGKHRLEQLEVLSRSREFMDRYAAVEALGKMAPEMPEAVPTLIRALRDSDVGVRGWRWPLWLP